MKLLRNYGGEMNKVYLDVTKRENCPAICIKDTEVITSGSTVYHMNPNDKNESYQLVLCQYLGHKKSNFFMLHFWLIIHIDLESCN